MILKSWVAFLWMSLQLNWLYVFRLNKYYLRENGAYLKIQQN